LGFFDHSSTLKADLEFANSIHHLGADASNLENIVLVKALGENAQSQRTRFGISLNPSGVSKRNIHDCTLARAAR
jgi:hypothetical protein